MFLNKTLRKFTQSPTVTLEQLGSGWEECSPEEFNAWREAGNDAEALEETPERITPRQLMKWLWINHQITRETIAAMLPDELARIEFAEALDFDRYHPMVIGMAEQLQFDVDTAWREASKL